MFLDLAQYAGDFGYIELLNFVSRTFVSELMFRFLSIFELIFANMDGETQLHCFSCGYEKHFLLKRLSLIMGYS